MMSEKEAPGSPCHFLDIKVEKILKGSLNLISSPLPSLKIQIMGGKVCLKFKGKTLFVFKSFLTRPSNILTLQLKQTFLTIIWIFTKGEGDEIKSKLSSYSFLLSVYHISNTRSIRKPSESIIDNPHCRYLIVFDWPCCRWKPNWMTSTFVN